MKKIFIALLALLLVFGFTGCQKKEDPNKKSEGVMTYAEFAAAPLDSKVTIETYVQGKQSWWDGKGTFYTQDGEGGYFLYEMACSEAEYNKLTPGTKIRVTGTKAAWAGEVEIVDAKYEILEGNYVATALDVTNLLGTDKLVEKINLFVSLKGLTVKDYGNGQAFEYKDTVGKTDDLYVKFEKNGVEFEFCVEFYLTGKDTDVYKAVEGLKIGDVVDIEGFLYWYNNPNVHMTKVTPAK